MGTSTADPYQQVTTARQDLMDAAGELDRRVTKLLDFQSHRAVAEEWGLRQLEERPLAVLGAGAFAVTAVAFVGIRAIGGLTKQSSGRSKRDRGATAVQLESIIQQAQVLLASETGQPVTPVKQEASMIKKLLWGVIMAGALALGGIFARQISTALWRAVMQEDPPSEFA